MSQQCVLHLQYQLPLHIFDSLLQVHIYYFFFIDLNHAARAYCGARLKVIVGVTCILKFTYALNEVVVLPLEVSDCTAGVVSCLSVVWCPCCGVTVELDG